MLVTGTLQFRNVSTREFAKLMQSLREISHNFTVEYKGVGATRKGEVLFLNTSWHLIFTGDREAPTERREFFFVHLNEKKDEQRIVTMQLASVKPANGVFEELRVTFGEV